MHIPSFSIPQGTTAAGILLLVFLALASPALASSDGQYVDSFGNTLSLAIVDTGAFIKISGENGQFQGPGTLLSDQVYEITQDGHPAMILFLGEDNLLLTPASASLVSTIGPFAGPYYRPDAIADFIPPTFVYGQDPSYLVLENGQDGLVNVTLATPQCSLSAGGGLIGNHGVQVYHSFELALAIYYAPEFAIVHSLDENLCPGLGTMRLLLNPDLTARLRDKAATPSTDGIYRSASGTIRLDMQDEEQGSVQLQTGSCSYEGLLTMYDPHLGVTTALGSDSPLAAFFIGNGYLLAAPLSDRFCSVYEDFTGPFLKDGVAEGQFEEPGGTFANGSASISIFYSGEQLAQVTLQSPECSFSGEGVVFLNHALRISGERGELAAMMWYDGDQLAFHRMDGSICPQCPGCDGLYTRSR